MKKVYILLLLASSLSYGQSLIQSVNSGSISNSNIILSVGEIVVKPNNDQPSTGTIGLLTEVNSQVLSMNTIELSNTVSVYPNPSKDKIMIQSVENLTNTKVLVYNLTGQQVLSTKISSENSVDLTALPSGVYNLQLDSTATKPFKIIKY